MKFCWAILIKPTGEPSFTPLRSKNIYEIWPITRKGNKLIKHIIIYFIKNLGICSFKVQHKLNGNGSR